MGHSASILRARLESGATVEEGLAHLRAFGVSPVETIKAICQVLSVSLGEAKVIFSASPAWKREVLAARELREEVLRVLDGKGE